MIEQRATTVRCTTNAFGQQRCYRDSPWNRYGRWILLGVIVFLFVLILFLRVRARRRMRNVPAAQRTSGGGGLLGRIPIIGKRFKNQNQQNNMNMYSQNPEAGYGGANAQPHYAGGGAQQEYYPQQNQYGQQNGYVGKENYGGSPEVMQPQNTYQPPSGPPPGQGYQPPAGAPPGYFRQ